ncbi:uncharacterized protein LOC131154190 [Malania oleifera]|uniref:uncharacterized protein LOC131154190 n=1 Tax=Malania oleifera TaxID=397392 RepID=UPI0025ADB404|nr:uncharacterized protein LOC131154190 [Malania oleifera]
MAMAHIGVSPFVEGQSLFRPPVFCGVDYTIWKVRMTIFLKSMDWRMWLVTTKGRCAQINETDFNMINSNAMNMLYLALDSDIFVEFVVYQTAQEIWDELKKQYEKSQKTEMVTPPDDQEEVIHELDINDEESRMIRSRCTQSKA